MIDLMAEMAPGVTADVIEAYARVSGRLQDLAEGDRGLALALLGSIDPLCIYVTAEGELVSSGRHRICAARWAGVTALPVWHDATRATLPATAQPLQHGTITEAHN
ncbi:hypothetical protein ORI20_29665 [Mycobacterium sp. CVI_P3]|uniref:ParB/Sulfiredoxin domain-containing protein n=1 Tax=Mycobacterium pinniadriaticum TaxID=2994102 RepID=A0ABT3SMV0_9MYCO|nr:hypothetical protein [Mycobacterium pinniadriaticum]MCX2934441.1 hypothetical protein [Mycobacterium pinniadriaticum]MCX2940864.1 hypothetical protein [Mycobacterium pinniadriaticum]